MKNLYVTLLVIATIFASTGAYALPALQVDIKDGVYDTTTETIVATGNPFSVYALIDGSKKIDINATFTLVVSVVPQSDGSGIGTFTIDGSAPSSGTLGMPTELSPHGIFPTYYWEYDFMFDTSKTATPYNAQDFPGGLVVASGTNFYYKEFLVDVTGLDPSVMLHFDLYGDDKFAPYSHDGQSAVPIPAPILLLGTGLVGLAGIRRRMNT